MYIQVIFAEQLKCTQEILIIVSMLSVPGMCLIAIITLRIYTVYLTYMRILLHQCIHYTLTLHFTMNILHISITTYILVYLYTTHTYIPSYPIQYRYLLPPQGPGRRIRHLQREVLYTRERPFDTVKCIYTMEE